jgi:hypothetical protein
MGRMVPGLEGVVTSRATWDWCRTDKTSARYFHIEGDFRLFSVDEGIDFADVVADFLGLSRNGYLPRGKLSARGDDQTHYAASVAGKYGGYLGNAQELVYVHYSPRGIALRNNLGIVGEGTLEKLRNYLSILEAEEHLALLLVHGDFHGFLLLTQQSIQPR